MTTRVSIRIAGLAIVAVEILATVSQIQRTPAMVVLAVLALVQLGGLLWITDEASPERLRVVVPAMLTGVATGAVWLALAFVVPGITEGDATPVLAIVVAGAVVAIWPPHGATRRRPLVMLAAAVAALLIFMEISLLLPLFNGFVTNWHAPTYADVTRLVDPVFEGAIFVLLALALCADVVWSRFRKRRSAARTNDTDEATPNEMVVLSTDSA